MISTKHPQTNCGCLFILIMIKLSSEFYLFGGEINE